MSALAKRKQEKIQTAIRDLAKKRDNKLCFDCQKMGPHPVVCLTYGIFVCNSCGGLHRSFAHKVKGISMTSFSDAEFESLQTIGNKKARKIWLAKYKKATFPIDDDTPVSKIKTFIHKCFEQKEWYSTSGHTGKKTERRKKPRKKERKIAPASNDSFVPSEEEYVSEEEEVKDRRTKPIDSGGDSILDILDLNKITMFPQTSQGDHTGRSDDLLDNNLLVQPQKRVQAPASQPAPRSQAQQQQRTRRSNNYFSNRAQVQEEGTRKETGPSDVFAHLPRRIGGDSTDDQQRAIGMILNQLRNFQTEYGFGGGDLKNICKHALVALHQENEQARQPPTPFDPEPEPIHPAAPSAHVEDARNPFADDNEDEVDENPFGTDHLDQQPTGAVNPFADDDAPPQAQYSQQPPPGYPNPYQQGYPPQPAPGTYQNPFPQQPQHGAYQNQKDPFSSLNQLS